MLRLPGTRALYKRLYSTARPPAKGYGTFTRVLVGSTLFAGGVGLGTYYSDSSKFRQSTLPVNVLGNPRYATPEAVASALREIREIVGEAHVSVNLEVKEQHADSEWQYRHKKTGEDPAAVVFPESTEEISKILKVCNAYRLPITAFSGGTSLEGHFTPVYGGISLDLNRMNRILEVHPDDLDVVVQPAVGWEELNDHLKDYGLQFGPDPGPGAEIGGMVGTSCSGTNAYRYGTMRQNVLSLTVVLADGTVIKTRKRPRKTAAGYSLTDLFVGAEGTLGVVTEATLKVHARPAVRRVGALSFPTVTDATQTVQHILRSGLQLDAMELMDEGQMRLINKSGITNRKWDEHVTLLLRFAGPDDKTVKNDISAVTAISKAHKSIDLVFAKNDDEGAELWSARKNSLFSVLYSAPKGYKTFGTDTAVPISYLSLFVEEAQRKIKESGLIGTVLGHVGDGNFHVCFAYDPQTQRAKVQEVADWLARRSLELDGTCTGEHGIGMGKRILLLEEVGENSVDLMRKVKWSLDPNLILNPGKIFSVQAVGDRGDFYE